MIENNPISTTYDEAYIFICDINMSVSYIRSKFHDHLQRALKMTFCCKKSGIYRRIYVKKNNTTAII